MALIDKRSRLGETQSLQQFSRDADEANAWINEKLQTTLDESYKDPTNIQVRAKSSLECVLLKIASETRKGLLV